MAFTYTGNPMDNQIDAIRFAIGDTNEASPILQDAEIEYIINTSKTAGERLAKAFRQAATMLGARVAKRSLGPQSEDATERLRYYRAMADKYEQYNSFTNLPPLPDYSADKVFEKGMMVNET